MSNLSFATPKDSRTCQEKLCQWLNDNLDDPYNQATGKSRDSKFVYGDDFTLVPFFPKVHVDIAEYTPKKVAVQSKTTYMEDESHMFIIYYYNRKDFYYVFDDGQKLNNEAQCRKYLQTIQHKLKAKFTDFNEYFHQPVFGTIPKPVYNQPSMTFMSMLPLTVRTYRR